MTDIQTIVAEMLHDAISRALREAGLKPGEVYFGMCLEAGLDDVSDRLESLASHRPLAGGEAEPYMEAVFDGNAVWNEIPVAERKWVPNPAGVSVVLDAVARIAKRAAAPIAEVMTYDAPIVFIDAPPIAPVVSVEVDDAYLKRTKNIPDSELREQICDCYDDWQRVCDALGADGHHMDPEDVVRAITEAATPTVAVTELPEVIKKVRAVQLFEDGLEADLHGETLANAYMLGRQDALDELEAALLTGKRGESE
jgi:hypothetical protein